jgi:hypothetical protein
MAADLLIPVAQYLRMSTEHQQYSLDNQRLAIQAYTDSHNLSVVKTYADRVGINDLVDAALVVETRNSSENVSAGKLFYRLLKVWVLLPHDLTQRGRLHACFL